MFTKLLVIGVGGFFGAISRFTISSWVQDKFGPNFPLGTLVVNILGSLLIGILIPLVEDRHLFSPEAKALIITGFLGALTTFSTFSFETYDLIRDSQHQLAALVVGLNVVLCICAVWLADVGMKAMLSP